MDYEPLLDVSALLDNIAPTANITANYPNELPPEDDIPIKGDRRTFGVTSMETDRNSKGHAQEPDTVYIVCDRPGFRAESLYNDLSREYKCRLAYLTDPDAQITDIPICFVVDGNTTVISSYAKHMRDGLKQFTATRKLPIFLIGEPEDLENVRRNIPFPQNTIICEFPRPIDMKECLKKIKDILLSAETEVEKRLVLVVDDSITFLRLIQRILEKQYDVVVCTSAFNCICTIANLPKMPDMIIVDKAMPDCDGTVLARMLKGEPRTKDIPIIFYTSSNSSTDIIELMQIGIDNYLLKSEPVIKLREYLDDKFNEKEVIKNVAEEPIYIKV